MITITASVSKPDILYFRRSLFPQGDGLNSARHTFPFEAGTPAIKKTK